jgi:hypothetical protein
MVVAIVLCGLHGELDMTKLGVDTLAFSLPADLTEFGGIED